MSDEIELVEALTETIDGVTMDPEKRERVVKLFKSFREIDAAIEPFKEQKKELRESYVEQQWLTNDEFSLAKKAYNFLKKGTSLDEVGVFMDAGKEAFPDGGEN